jgi:hypothetical protein
MAVTYADGVTLNGCSAGATMHVSAARSALATAGDATTDGSTLRILSGRRTHASGAGWKDAVAPGATKLCVEDAVGLEAVLVAVAEAVSLAVAVRLFVSDGE